MLLWTSVPAFDVQICSSYIKLTFNYSHSHKKADYLIFLRNISTLLAFDHPWKNILSKPEFSSWQDPIFCGVSL